MKKQITNPYLPSYEYIPDGEPHVFNNRLYIYGSHDKFNGKLFCLNDYVTYSAPIDDLSDFKYEGVTYKKSQDKTKNLSNQLWAPDVCKGVDGNYYMYYCKAFSSYIGVAKANNPAGPFEYYGKIAYHDNVIYGKKENDLPFDPGVLVGDDGRVFLYTGMAPKDTKFRGFVNKIFGLHMTGDCSYVLELENDMKTIKSVKELIPGPNKASNTSFEGHSFYEASSIRKFNGKYYFIYSSELSHELAYAVSDYPDKGFEYKGILHSNANLGIDNEASFPWGNNHGSIECINGEYYIFGHRQTNYSEYSRQGVAEKLIMDENGLFKQAEMTSLGLNAKPLLTNMKYSAAIACVLKGKNGAIKAINIKNKKDYPMITQQGVDDDKNSFQYIKNITDGSIIGYKYFDFLNNKKLTLTYKGKGNGSIDVYQDDPNTSKAICSIRLNKSSVYTDISTSCEFADGVYPLYFVYNGKGNISLKSFNF